MFLQPLNSLTITNRTFKTNKQKKKKQIEKKKKKELNSKRSHSTSTAFAQVQTVVSHSLVINLTGVIIFLFGQQTL